MMRRRLATLALGVTAGVGVVGCGSGHPDDAVSDPAIAWVEQVCQAVASGGEALSRVPSVDPSDPQAAKASLVGYLDVLSEALKSVQQGITTAGSPPIADGESAVTKALRRLADTAAAIDAARVQLAQTQVTDQTSLAIAQAGIGAQLAHVDPTFGPIDDLKANPGFRAAFATAPACKRVVPS